MLHTDYAARNLLPLEREGYLQTQIGNSDDTDQPNKKYYDPRVWLRRAEESFQARLVQVSKNLNNINTLK